MNEKDTLNDIFKSIEKLDIKSSANNVLIIYRIMGVIQTRLAEIQNEEMLNLQKPTKKEADIV